MHRPWEINPGSALWYRTASAMVSTVHLPSDWNTPLCLIQSLENSEFNHCLPLRQARSVWREEGRAREGWREWGREEERELHRSSAEEEAEDRQEQRTAGREGTDRDRIFCPPRRKGQAWAFLLRDRKRKRERRGVIMMENRGAGITKVGSLFCSNTVSGLCQMLCNSPTSCHGRTTPKVARN